MYFTGYQKQDGKQQLEKYCWLSATSTLYTEAISFTQGI
jgi:hypothetical protein